MKEILNIILFTIGFSALWAVVLLLIPTEILIYVGVLLVWLIIGIFIIRDINKAQNQDDDDNDNNE